MSSDLDLVMRLLAFEAGRASRRASHRRVAVRSDALVVCPIAMAGEDTSGHVVAYGAIGQPPQLLHVPDPRFRDDQYQLFAALGRAIEARFQAARATEAYPQLWVPSAAAVSHIDILADRLRFNQHNAQVRRFGELLTYSAERYPVAGQQALLAATEVLKDHWATGQQDGEDEHLGAILTWIEPPVGVNVLAAVAAAEREPRGIKTDPQFDMDFLEPLVAAYNQARRDNASAAELALRSQQILDLLRPVVTPIYQDTQRAIRALLRLNLPLLPDLRVLEQRESEEFESFMASRDAGHHLPLRDSAKAAAFKLSAREEAIDNVEAALLVGDRVERARARLTGHVLVARVTNTRTAHVGPHRFEHYVEVESTQAVRRIRPRDELLWLDDPRLRVVVESITRSGGVTQAVLRMAAGIRAVGLPQIGVTLELSEHVPEWDALIRQRKHLKTRLATTPWTHTAGGALPAGPTRAGMPADPLAAVEALR